MKFEWNFFNLISKVCKVRPCFECRSPITASVSSSGAKGARSDFLLPRPAALFAAVTTKASIEAGC